MGLTYEQAVAEIQKLPNGGDLIETLTEKVHSVNSEAQGLRSRFRTTESSYNKLKEALKNAELDPDSDVVEQINNKLKKSTEGLKPASEVEEVLKRTSKLEKRLEESEARAIQLAEKAQMAEARSAFNQVLPDIFGKTSKLILENALKDGIIRVQEGVPGVLVNEEFTPLNTEKGLNGLDVLKKLYPEHVIVKQVGGSRKVSSKAPLSDSEQSDDKVMNRKEFDTLDAQAKMDFMKAGGKLED